MIQPRITESPLDGAATLQKHSPGQREFFIPLLAVAVAGLGLLNLWSALLAHGPHRAAILRDVVHMPLYMEHGSRTLIAVFGLCLLMIARSLAHRKRQAWELTVLLIAPSPFLHFAKGLDWEEAMICEVLLVALLVYRRSFYAENDKPSAKQGLFGAMAFFGFAAIYGPAGFLLLHEHFKPDVTLQRAILESTHLLIGSPSGSVLMPLTVRADWFEDTLLLISATAIIYGIIMVLRPVLPRGLIEERERHEARRLLETWGGPPLAYFYLLPDKQYLFGPNSPTPTSSVIGRPLADGTLPTVWAVAYRVVNGCAVALGDPIGDPRCAVDAIRHFIALCRQFDWLPAFYQVTSKYLDEYRAAGLKVFKVGEDAVVHLDAFSLKGRAYQDLRTAMNKMTRVGIVFEECDPHYQSGDDIMTQLAEITEDWLDAHHAVEKGFAMGQFAPGTDAFSESRLFVARDSQTDSVLAFVTFVPIYAGCAGIYKSGWGLDLMRRRTTAPNGVMDFLIASAAVHLQAEGAQVMSLGLSPMAGSEEDEKLEGDVWLERLRALLFERFNQFYHFKGLNSFKAKFGPEWESRYLVFPAASHLPTVAYAVISAHTIVRLRTIFRLTRGIMAAPAPPRPSVLDGGNA